MTKRLTKRRKSTAKRTGSVQRGVGKSESLGGQRKGTKRSDLRYIAPDGSEWASPFEYRVYAALREQGVNVHKCDTSCAQKYTTPVKQGRCELCQSTETVQDRTYTPDLVVWIPLPGEGRRIDARVIYLETKGYFPGPKRNLFRQARLSNPDADIRLVVSSDHWVTKGKTRLTDWARRYKIPICVWNGSLPEDWL